MSLAVKGRLYPAHKFVLSTCSDYFKEIFNKTPCVHPVIFLKDVTEKDVESLLDFMYKVSLDKVSLKKISDNFLKSFVNRAKFMFLKTIWARC